MRFFHCWVEVGRTATPPALSESCTAAIQKLTTSAPDTTDPYEENCPATLGSPAESEAGSPSLVQTDEVQVCDQKRPAAGVDHEGWAFTGKYVTSVDTTTVAKSAGLGNSSLFLNVENYRVLLEKENDDEPLSPSATLSVPTDDNIAAPDDPQQHPCSEARNAIEGPAAHVVLPVSLFVRSRESAGNPWSVNAPENEKRGRFVELIAETTKRDVAVGGDDADSFALIAGIDSATLETHVETQTLPSVTTRLVTHHEDQHQTQQQPHLHHHQQLQQHFSPCSFYFADVNDIPRLMLSLRTVVAEEVYAAGERLLRCVEADHGELHGKPYHPIPLTDAERALFRACLDDSTAHGGSLTQHVLAYLRIQDSSRAVATENYLARIRRGDSEAAGRKEKRKGGLANRGCYYKSCLRTGQSSSAAQKARAAR